MRSYVAWKALSVVACVSAFSAGAAQDQSGVSSSPLSTWPKSAIKPRVLTSAISNRMDYNPIFSPDGKFVLFSRNIGKAAGKLFTVSVSGGEPKVLARDQLPVDQSRPSWSAKSDQIAFTGCTGSDQANSSCGVWIMNGDGTSAHPISIEGASNQLYYPSWYPDGKSLAVLDANNLVIRRVDTVSGATAVLTDHSKVLTGMPAVSPDGKWIAFAGQRNEGLPYNQQRNSIWLIDQSGTMKLLEGKTLQGRTPTWSPDSQFVAFESNRGNPSRYAIFVADINGTNLTQITNFGLVANHPSWSHDGRHMAFAYEAPGDPSAWGIAIIDYPEPH